jgi:NAD(P)-dependent dehydrogenase (short-subunit alcohol dehydrogenase family)
VKISNSVAFVTGANRGLGLAFAQELLARGARTVYAGVRNVDGIELDGVVPVTVDVTDASSVQAAAEHCGDATLLINNAGIGEVTAGALDPNFIPSAQRMFDTNFYGIVRASQAFAPAISRNGGGAIVNVLSDVTWYARGWNAAYATTKSAAWSFSNSLRLALRDNGVQVLSLHVGFMDTDMARGFDTPKTAPRVIAATTLDGLEDDQDEVLADEQSRTVKKFLSGEPPYYVDPPALVISQSA